VVLDRAPRELTQLEVLALQMHLAAGDAGDVEQVLDQAGHMADLAIDDRLRPASLAPEQARGRHLR
jgi:hypothetical protein